jgi:SNF2 domain-containing protein/helicase-like protein
VARRGQPQTRARRTAPRDRRRGRDREDVISLLANTVREVEAAIRGGRVTSTTRTKFQAVALLLRDERARVRADAASSETHRADQLKRLDGVATILAKAAVRDAALLALLAEDAVVSDEARSLKREMLSTAGLEAPVEEPPPVEEPAAAAKPGVVPQSVVSRQLANPFLAPDRSAARPPAPRATRLATWELIGPLLSSFERAGGGAPACMALPAPSTRRTPPGRELMPHQARLVAAAEAGHRTFLLADEPGLGKTAQALLAAEAANAYPLLVVVPNVVKTNWAREAGLWTPRRTATVVHGNGDTIDGFADIVIVNYEVLDRHVGWLGEFGLRGMVVDEAHFIKNKTAQRSQHVLALSERIRSRTARPLLMALTGTPLINDIDDFRAIWQYLGWIDETKPLAELMHALDETGRTPADPGFYTAARQCVVDLGIVRRRKVDVAADIPARRIADLPVELDGAAGRSIRAAERDLARRMVARYETALASRRSGGAVEGIDHDLVRQVARWEQKDAATSTTGENVFGMMRRIGQAKAGLAADYAAQLARSAGKVVFFAKHVDVMDVAEETFAKQGVRFSSIRGDQTPRTRQANIDAFVEDPDVAVAVCSLTAAGVGINLQVASNIVLAELSWTAAEQTQAIDRSHRIGQSEPVTAWRIIAAQTIDARIAELIDSKAGLAAQALDGSEEEVGSSADVQHEALVALLTEALRG